MITQIAILLTVYNRKEKTLACLQSIYKQSSDVYKFEVYLTNDNCTDGTPEAVAENFPNVNIIEGGGNLYWNRGMYKAWKTAANMKRYDFYLWLNDDTNLYLNAISTMVSCSEIFKNKAIIVGTTCAREESKVKITYGGRSLKKGLLIPAQTPIACDYFNGNIVLIPKCVYERVGTNDPIFHHALGDFDYGLRAKKVGIKSIVSPNIQGECDKSEILPTWCNPNEKFLARWTAFRTPLGHNPEEFFIYNKRHNGLFIGVIHYITAYLRVLFPKLWIMQNHQHLHQNNLNK